MCDDRTDCFHDDDEVDGAHTVNISVLKLPSAVRQNLQETYALSNSEPGTIRAGKSPRTVYNVSDCL